MVDFQEILAWIFMGTILVYLFATIWSDTKGAPYLPTKRRNIQKILEMAEIKPGDTIFDLGCGDGRVLIMAAKKFGANGVGIEINPFRYIRCLIKITFLGLHGKIKIKFGDIFKHDLSCADIVFCYLLQSTNNKLEWKLNKELSKDAKIVSNNFMFNTLILLKKHSELDVYLYSAGIVP